ncbi:predicted protein [Histoplasma capsulatum G186AR]|uniref:Uncharacterized protein n=1 Tax=Ajellomyces capsulatus (strain G186AR / H82 / ATCC MYA-2454 / RMSCC 2432) TaxID=447093 RepID=C0NVK3_AJECG|nr:uncharacterized protein HCBG_07183 [Histoplasma capsulatum G186AR]EEH04542.1 predicted protein [Histoplasma capsulatum G186AR]
MRAGFWRLQTCPSGDAGAGTSCEPWLSMPFVALGKSSHHTNTHMYTHKNQNNPLMSPSAAPSSAIWLLVDLGGGVTAWQCLSRQQLRSGHTVGSATTPPPGVTRLAPETAMGGWIAFGQDTVWSAHRKTRVRVKGRKVGYKNVQATESNPRPGRL